MAIDVGTQRPGFRLTRRGRMTVRVASWVGLTLALTMVAIAIVVFLAAVNAPGAQAGDGRAATGAGESVAVVVGPGDSLWSLAERHQPDRDPRDVVVEIEAVNGLVRGAVLPIGTTLQVPVS